MTEEELDKVRAKIRSMRGDNVVRIKKRLTPDATAEWGEVDASLLDDRRGELPAFPLAALSAPIAKFVERAAHAAGVTPCHVALPLLSISSALIGAARLVKPSRGWSEPMSFWGGIIGASGTGKTPGIAAIKSALAQIERDRKLKTDEMERKHESRSEAAKAAHKKWLKEVEDAVANGKPAPAMPPEAVKIASFVPPRLYAADATIERLAVLLQARPSGLLLIVDELAGLFANMGRYSNGSDREFWLEAWNGKPYSVDRMGRAPVMVDHLLVGIIGGMQPDKLTRAFSGDADGMYARFCFAWPPEPAYRPLSNESCEVEPDLVNALTRLSRLAESEEDVFAPRPISLDAGAVAAFEQFRQFLHAGKDVLDGREREWWAKGATQVLRLAGTLTFLNWAWSLGQSEPQTITAVSVNAAVILWRDYFHPHSKAALRQIGLTDQQADARRVLKWIRLKGLTEISREDIRREALRQKLNAEQTEAVLNSLTRLNWLQKRTIPHGSKAGRHAHRWLVNPCLATPTAEIAEIAEMGAGRAEMAISAIPAISAPSLEDWK